MDSAFILDHSVRRPAVSREVLENAISHAFGGARGTRVLLRPHSAGFSLVICPGSHMRKAHLCQNRRPRNNGDPHVARSMRRVGTWGCDFNEFGAAMSRSQSGP